MVFHSCFSLFQPKMAPKPSRMGAGSRPSFLARHKPSAVVLASQISAGLVHGVVKVLENGDDAVDPFQILLIRMVITGVGCSLFLYHQRVPEFPLGDREVRPLLLLRAVGGILGAGGMYCKSNSPSRLCQYRPLTTLQTRSNISPSLRPRP